MEPRAAAAAGATASNGGGESPSPSPSSSSAEGQDGDGGATLVVDGNERGPGGSSGGAGTVLLYVACSVFGGVLGGAAVGLWLGKKDARQVYESINGSGATRPAL